MERKKSTTQRRFNIENDIVIYKNTKSPDSMEILSILFFPRSLDKLIE